HPIFYYKDGSFRMQLGNTLYNLHLSLLAERSTVFKNMLTMPAPRGIEVEGSSDENPMVLPSTIKQDELDILLEYMFKGHTAGAPSLKNLIVILKLSTMLEIDDGWNFAINELQKDPGLSPALQFHLGCAHHVIEWVEPAFRVLMEMPFSEITEEMAHLMGPDAFYILSQTHARIRNHKTILAFYPSDPITSIRCFRPGKCSEAWVTQWWQGVAKHLLHPESGKSGSDILKMLEELGIPGMCPHCQKENVEWVKDTGVMTKAE
ncbi:hypothetical protein NEOLEDRAFT_1046430, partial [Neolentinus lepideus HHB14362 ss-1]